MWRDQAGRAQPQGAVPGAGWAAQTPALCALTCVGVGLLQQLAAGVHVGEGADAKAVGGVQLGLQEVTAVLSDIHQLQ